MKKAFTLVEVMIVAVIISLLAAMAIPAVQKVKAERIGKCLKAGKNVSEKDRQYYIQYVKAHKK
jgi:type IV pilus assembly protein PilA